MDRKIIASDFEYYERAIKKVYKDHYRKCLIFLFVLLGLEIFVSFFSYWTWLNSIITIVILLGIGYMIKELKSFSLFLNKEKELSEISKFSEDKMSYYIFAENLKFAKKTARNLPSREKGLTFFIGIEPFKLINPIHVRYYDMLELTYTDKFKQDKANVSYAKSRWKYRITSWLKSLPLILFFIYIFFFRLSFIWVALREIILGLF